MDKQRLKLHDLLRRYNYEHYALYWYNLNIWSNPTFLIDCFYKFFFLQFRLNYKSIYIIIISNNVIVFIIEIQVTNFIFRWEIMFQQLYVMLLLKNQVNPNYCNRLFLKVFYYCIHLVNPLRNYTLLFNSIESSNIIVCNTK